MNMGDKKGNLLDMNLYNYFSAESVFKLKKRHYYYYYFIIIGIFFYIHSSLSKWTTIIIFIFRREYEGRFAG